MRRIAGRATPFALLVALVALSCGTDDDPAAVAATDGVVAGDITVLAAASLTEAYEDIGAAFTTEHPGVEVTFGFGSSSDLVRQITEGAPADVYASADQANMTKLTDAGAAGATPAVFATNSLRIIVGAGNPRQVTDLADLADPDLVVVMCPPEVPIGRYAAEVLAKAGVTVTPRSYEENVKAIVNKVTLGEADAGIVYSTDVSAAGTKASGVDIPTDLAVTAEYPMVVTRESSNPATAQAFVDFVLGEQGQGILASHGFGPP